MGRGTLIDPTISLAHSIFTNKGVYALLLGSGVSRAAGIPTGWEIVLDLISQLACLENEEIQVDPVEWYRSKYGREPDYSEILEILGRSAIERQQMLTKYFEPTEDERDAQQKAPTTAHKAIASLVVAGYIKVIVTTNFDRLVEQSLEEAGITPVVLSTTDSVRGAKPLVHQDCVVVKVHGDYLDPRIKNSPTELATYDTELNALLDRIVDEYGIITCGWSGEWDEALRSVFQRSPNRRYPLYWAARRSLQGNAKQLVEARDGIHISIEDADSFFEDIAGKVLGLQDFTAPHPLSTPTAAATAKRYLSDPRHRIKLHDLVSRAAEDAFERLQQEFASRSYDSELRGAVANYWQISEILRAIGMNVAFFSDAESQMLQSTLIRLTNDPLDGQSGTKVNFTVRSTAATMLLYTVGIAGCANDQIGQTIAVAKAPLIRQDREDEAFISALHWPTLNQIFESCFDGKKYFPASEWLFENCKESLNSLIPDPAAYERHFNRFEVLLSMLYLATDRSHVAGGRSWAPLGRFAWQYNRSEKFLENFVNDSPLVDAILSSRVYLSKQDVHKAKDLIVKLIAERNLR